MDAKKPDAAPEAPAPGGLIDVQPMLDAIKLEPRFQRLYDAAVLSGMRIMFDKKSHPMMEEQLAKPGPLAQKIIEGIVTLVYMLWKQSNQTLAPQIIVPLTVALTLKAFDFIQKSGDPEATKEVLGDAVEGAARLVMKKFGVTDEMLAKIEAAGQQAAQKQQAQPAAGAAPTGMLAQGEAP